MREPRHQLPFHMLISEEEKAEMIRHAEEIREQARAQREERKAERGSLLAKFTSEELESMGIKDVEAASACDCDCHPRPPRANTHGGNLCICQRDPEEIAAERDRILRDLQQIGQQQDLAERMSDSRRKLEEVAADLGCELEEAGGFAPYQIIGRVDGMRFYLRERHGQWRIQIPDIEAGQDGDPVGTDTGTLIIDEGDEAELYRDDDPAHPLKVAVRSVRLHLQRAACLHAGSRKYCPDCGKEMDR